MEASAELKAQYPWLSMAPNQAWFKAKQGDLEAQYVLGMCHLHGVQQEKSAKTAASWLSKAAISGHVAAQFHIGLLWLEGKGVTQQDETEATKWLQKAASAGHPEALYNMGVLCLNGTGMPQSGKEAANFFYQAAELGNSEAQFRYAMVLERKVHKERRQEADRVAQEAAERAAARLRTSSEDGSEEAEEKEVEDSDEESDDDIFGVEETEPLEPLQPSDVQGSIRDLLGQSLHWLIKAADKNHGMAQHKAALLYMLGVEPVDPDKDKHGIWHMRPSVVTWGKSYVHALLVREAKPFSRNPSVVSWNIAMKEKQVEMRPNLEKAAEWHEKAANNGMLASAYATAIAKETGRGTSVALDEAFESYKIAATGLLSSSEGSMHAVEYICPHCLTWNPNRRTKETPKGNNRCRQCKEERYFSKDLLVRNPLADYKFDNADDHKEGKKVSRGKDMTKLVDRVKHLDGADITEEGSKPSTAAKKAIKVVGRAGNPAADEDATNEQLVYNVGGGSMVIIASDRPEPEPEADASKLRRQDTQLNAHSAKKGHAGTFQTFENELSQIGGGRPGSNQTVLIAGQGTMTAAQVRNSIKITHLDFTATPKIMHIFNPIGRLCHATIKNEATIDSGLFFVEFYVCGREEKYREAGKPVYGGRVLVPNLEAYATAIVSMDVGARCPLQVAAGANKLWAGIRPWQAKDLPGANLNQLRSKAVAREHVAMLHLADATFHGQAGVVCDIREAVRWYNLCKGTLDIDGVDIASAIDVDVMVMMTGPIPLDLNPTTLVRGYQPAWLALAMNLDAATDAKPDSSATSLSKFEREMVGDQFEMIPGDGIPAMWMYHAAFTADMAQAQLNLAIWYVHGQHVPRSLQQACYWFEQAAKAGLQDAQYNLGLLLQAGNGIPMDHKKAAQLYQLAVDQGHIDAHLSLGMCYLEGKGVEKDTEWAVQLLHIPANKGSATAQFNLGCLYARGLGVRKDDRSAVSWYIKAAGQGHREAQICYAMALYRGQGTAKNFAHAARLFEEAGTMGHPQAQYNIGVMYSRGEGVPQDREKAAFWWEKSASQGHGSAQLELGQYYLLLARETVQRYFEARVAKLRQIVASTEYFEKFIMVEKWQLGFGKVEGVPMMNVRLFLRMLTDFMLLIPDAISREEVVSMMQKVDKLRDEPFENKFSYRKFKVYVRGLGKLIGVELEAGANEGKVDEWTLAKRQKKLEKVKKQEEKEFAKKVKHEMIESQGIFSYLREGKQRKPPRFDDAQHRVTAATSACDSMRAKIKREDGFLKAHRWKAQDAIKKFKEAKNEADVLTTKKKMHEAAIANAQAERCRVAQNKAEEQADKQEEQLAKYTRELKRLEHGLRLAQQDLQAISQEQFDEDLGGFEIEMQQILAGLEKEKTDFIAIRTDATELKDSYIRCAAELFLDAAQRGVADAQFRVGQLFKGDEVLPHSWIPNKFEDVEDKDRPGLNAYRQAVHALRLQEEADHKKAMEPFSFQGQIDSKVNEMKKLTALQFQHVAALGPRHAKLLRALDEPLSPPAQKKGKRQKAATKPAPEGAHKSVTPEVSRLSTASSVAPVSAVNKFEVLSIEDYAHQDFLEWREKRFRVERAAFWFKKSADNNHHEAKVELAMMLQHGHLPSDDPRKQNYIPFPRNYEQAAVVFKEAAILNNRRGQYEFGKCLLAGCGVDVDAVQGVDMLKRSAEQGLVEAKHQLGMCYEQGVGVEVAKAEAVKLYRDSAEAGYVDAMISLAMCLEAGAGVEKDEPAAFRWYKEAADKSSKALMMVGRCYKDGVGVPKDENLAAETYLAAASTHEKAQLQLGISYQYGIGVRRNPEEAVLWYGRAAEAGNVDSMLNLAYCYADGIGVREDMSMYETWLERAVNAGSAKAASLLGMRKGRA